MSPESGCAGNLGPRQSVRRLWLGLVTLAAAAVGLAILVHRGLAPGARIGLFPVWWAGMYGIFQARHRT